jgi:hypothetical protein
MASYATVHNTNETTYIYKDDLEKKFKLYVKNAGFDSWGGNFYWEENKYIFTNKCTWQVTLDPIKWTVRIEDIDYDGCSINMDETFLWRFVKHDDKISVQVINYEKNHRHSLA